jgi:hypothetical protein
MPVAPATNATRVGCDMLFLLKKRHAQCYLLNLLLISHDSDATYHKNY